MTPKEIPWLIPGMACPGLARNGVAYGGQPRAISMIDLASWLGLRGVWGLFCVTLRSEPSHLSATAHPVVDVSLADETANDPDFRARNNCLNLPIGFSDPLWLEYDTGRFAHPANMAPNRADS